MRRQRLYNCGGWSNYSGPCGAPDCTSCNPGFTGYVRCDECGDDFTNDEVEEVCTPDGEMTLCRSCREDLPPICEDCGEAWAFEEGLCEDCIEDEEEDDA
jgi:hypothetical protein